MIDNNSKEFIYRHIGPSEAEQKKMLGKNKTGKKNLHEFPSNILIVDN